MEFSLTDLVSPDVLQSIQDGFSRFTGIALMVSDADGTPVTRPSGFLNLCSSYIRKSPAGRKRCERCDKEGALLTIRRGKQAIYTCHAGITEFSSPLIVQGEFIGCVTGGQVLQAPIPQEKILKTAEFLKIDPSIFQKEAAKIKILPKERIENMAVFVSKLSKSIALTAEDNYLRLKKTLQTEKTARSQAVFVTDMSERAKGMITAWMKMLANVSLSSQEDISELRRNVSYLRSNGKELYSRLEEFLGYTQIMNGNSDISESIYQLRLNLPHSINHLQDFAGTKEITISYNVDSSVPEFLFGNYMVIDSIFSNMIKDCILRTKAGIIHLDFSSEKSGYASVLKIKARQNTLVYSEESLEIIQDYFETGISALLEKNGMDKMGYQLVEMHLKKSLGSIEINSDGKNFTEFLFRIPQLEVKRG